MSGGEEDGEGETAVGSVVEVSGSVRIVLLQLSVGLVETAAYHRAIVAAAVQAEEHERK